MVKNIKKPSSRLKAIFWAQVAVFIILVSLMIVPGLNSEIRESIQWFFLPFFLGLSGLFLLLGITLIIVTLKEKIDGRLKKLLLLTGASSAGFVISVILHNLFYAVAIWFSDILILSYLMQIIQVIFFFAAIFVCPIGFLIGAAATGKTFLKNK